MLNFRRTAHSCRSAFFMSAFLGAMLAPLTLPLLAQGTHLWTQSTLEQLEKGTPQGVALTSDGHLRQGPGLASITTSPSTFVWSVAVDKNGTAYLGTQAPATVLRVDTKTGANSKPFTLFETRDVSVQVVRMGPDGSLYVATMPSGKVYKLNPDATTKQDDTSATLVFDMSKLPESEGGSAGADKQTKPHYIWDMTFDKEGRLYIATGAPAAVFRVDVKNPGAQPEEFFKSDEAHIRSLAWDANGNLIAGSVGTGLVYRINPQGKGYVIFDAPKGEITSLAVSPDGTIYAAGVGEKGHNPLPPLPVQGMATVTINIVQPGSMQAANQSTTVPEGTEIYALKEGEAPRTLWSSKPDIVYALAMRPDGLLAVSGNRGHVYLIHADGSYADIGHLDAQQGLCVAKEPGAAAGEVLIGTGNTGKLFRLGASQKHEYASDVLDAGALARFGRVEIEPGSSGYEIYTRSGNVDQPVRGWTDWEPLKDGVVASPQGRFLQWKVVLQPDGIMGSVGVNYLPVRSVPVVDQLVVVPGARLNPQITNTGQQTVNISFPSSGQSDVSTDDSSSILSALKDRTAVTVRWAAHDEDGDKMNYSLFLRGDGETGWWPLKKNITDTAYSFDATQIPDGGYQVKVMASDAPSEPPGQAVTGSKISDRFVIDTTPPAITGLSATAEASACNHAPCPLQVHVVFDATDATSPIARASYSVDAGAWQFVAPAGGLSDSKHEHYDFVVPSSALDASVSEHLITVRAYDRYDNVGLAKSLFQATPNQEIREKK
jgi:streptogramin lyase